MEAMERYNPHQSETDVFRVAEAMAKSGYFKDAKDAAQAVVKILAGRELGFGAFTSMSNIIIVEGKLTLSANMIAALVKRSKRYDCQVTEHTDKVCEIEFYQFVAGGLSKQSIGRSRFTMEDAQRAGLAGKFNWKNYPKNMLFARAMSNGAKWYCADVFATGIYTPEELGADVVDAEIEPNGTERDYTGGMDYVPSPRSYHDAETAGDVRPSPDFRQSIVDDPLGVGDDSIAETAAEPVRYPGGCTVNQIKRLQTIATATGWKPAEVRRLLKNTWGYASSKDITPTNYDLVCADLENKVLLNEIRAAIAETAGEVSNA